MIISIFNFANEVLSSMFKQETNLKLNSRDVLLYLCFFYHSWCFKKIGNSHCLYFKQKCYCWLYITCYVAKVLKAFSFSKNLTAHFFFFNLLATINFLHFLIYCNINLSDPCIRSQSLHIFHNTLQCLLNFASWQETEIEITSH